MVDELRTEEGMETQEKEETMEEMMQQFDVMGDFHRGKIVEGIIVDAREDGWLVDVGYKCEGFLPRKEWTHRVLVEDAPEPENGAKVRVQITNLSQGEEAQLGLSRWRCEFDERWNKLEEEAEKNETINVKGIRKVKGGLIVSCYGIEGFIPISHLAEEGRGVNPGRLLEQDFPVKLIEKDRRKRRLVFSRRSLMEAEMADLRQSFYDQVHEGDVLEGPGRVVGRSRPVGGKADDRVGGRENEIDGLEQLGAGTPEIAFFGDIGVRAGKAGEIPDHRQFGAALRLRRQIDGEGHPRAGLDRIMRIDALRAAEAAAGGNRLDRHRPCPFRSGAVL